MFRAELDASGVDDDRAAEAQEFVEGASVRWLRVVKASPHIGGKGGNLVRLRLRQSVRRQPYQGVSLVRQPRDQRLRFENVPLDGGRELPAAGQRVDEVGRNAVEPTALLRDLPLNRRDAVVSQLVSF